MCVENSVVISGFKKDYELQSWNEQEEITQIEGIVVLTCRDGEENEKERREEGLLE